MSEHTKKACENCQFCEAGRCRRFPPVIFRYATDREFPAVRKADWCGEFKPAAEAKVEQ